jgi:TolB-like protein/Tfp pilus assembly protein PilF
MDPHNFFAELKRRNVYKVAVAYAVVGWLLVQVATQVFPFFEIPNWAVRLVVLAIVIGFPIALVIAWAFELTPEGLKRTEDVDLADARAPKRHAWIYIVAIGAAISLGLFFLGRYTAGDRASRSASDELRRGRQSEAATIPEKSIAVLAFQNKSGDADTEYLSDGLAESLIYRLSQLPNLKVSPTSSVFHYKGKEIDPVRIGSELGVNAVMSGRMVQRGENLTISIDLVDVRNNKLLWGEHYERKLSELLTTQREIAAEIAQKLQLQLSGEEAKGLTKHYTNSNEAYQLYLKGRYHFAKRTKDDILRGIEYFQQAIKRDSNFALAHAMIAESYAVMPAYPYLSPKEAFPQAKAAAKQALEIDSTIAEAHTALAYALATYDWNWLEAEREFKRALELDPNSSAPHFRYGQLYLMPLGRSGEAIAEVKRALELEPLSLNIETNFSWVYLLARRYDLALEQAKKTYDLEPSFPLAPNVLAQAYIAKGNYAEAIALSQNSLQTDPTNQFMLRDAGYAYAKAGRRREAEDVIKKFKDIGKTQYVMSAWIASIYAALGDKDKAFAELEEAFAERDWDLHRLKVDPFMDPLRDDPRFKALAKKIFGETQ